MEYDKFSIGTTDYSKNFWDKAMRGNDAPYEIIGKGKVNDNMFVLPTDSNRKYMDALCKESIFRSLATCVNAPRSDNKLWTSDADEPAQWVTEGGHIDVNENADVFVRHTIMCNKLAMITRIDDDYVHDIDFDVENYLINRLAKRFSKAEENAFINGTGIDMPTGILHETDGAEIGVTATALTYDEIIKLFFSLKAEYRKNGVWLMNDDTALALRTLKDVNGNYIWNQGNDTILGKPVCISEHMPNAESGNKAIVFGDFSYYWIVNRRPLAIRTLAEKYALHHQTGYLAYEFLDGKLIRPEAIKVLKMK